MSTQYRKLLLVIFTMLAISLACSIPGDGGQEDDAGDAIATSVEETLIARDHAAQETLTVLPTDTVTVLELEVLQPNGICNGVEFYYNNLLAEGITVADAPGFYDENNPWWSKPEHRVCVFIDWVLSDAFHTPAIRVYPIADFQAINENVAAGMVTLRQALEDQPPGGEDLRVPDLFNAGQLYQSNFQYIDFQNGRGARWLSQYGQAFHPIGWPHLFYTFQGITEDGVYYISMILPVNHPSLPHPDSVVLDDAFYETIETYTAEIKAQLEAEADASFMPSLVLLDQIVESLFVGH
jgi:hypothetical protein